MQKHQSRTRTRIAVGVVGPLVALVGSAVTTGAASAAPAVKTAKVVKVATRAPVGKMLVTIKGLSLYIHPGSACTGGCLGVWPALVMPAGKTIPKGARCLSTVTLSTGQVQVTYKSEPLYTFISDSGTSLNGNGLGGFQAATLVAGCL